MGSFLSIRAHHADRAAALAAMDEAFSEASRLERLLSHFDPASAVSRLNAAAGSRVFVGPEAAAALSGAGRLARLTGGAFDPTIAPLVRWWKSAPPAGPEALRRARASVSYASLSVDLPSGTARLARRGMAVELSAYAKGLAVDRAVAALRARGVGSAFVSFGSSSYALGAPPGRHGWRVAVQHPRRIQRCADVVRLRDRAIGTSGDYEQGLRFAGEGVCHVVDPRSGSPVRGVASATVLAASAAEADALSTAAFVLGPDEGRRLFDGIPDTEAFWIAGDGPALRSLETAGWHLARQSRRSGFARRALAAAASLAGLAAWPLPSRAVVFLTPEEAMQRLLPTASSYRVGTLPAGTRGGDPGGPHALYVGESGGRAVGYAVPVEVVGKEQPISFMVGVSPDGRVEGVEVRVYRESFGSEIRSPSFLRQFQGKTLSDPLKLGRDVDAISGATLSSRAAAQAVRRALALVEQARRRDASGAR